MDRNFFKSAFAGRSYTVVIGVIALGTSVFGYLSSSNNLELTKRLEMFENRIEAIEITQGEDHSITSLNRDSILVINTKLDNIESDLKDVKSDIKFIITK